MENNQNELTKTMSEITKLTKQYGQSIGECIKLLKEFIDTDTTD